MIGYKVVVRKGKHWVSPTMTRASRILKYEIGKTTRARRLGRYGLARARNPDVPCGPGINIVSSIARAKTYAAGVNDYREQGILEVHYTKKSVLMKHPRAKKIRVLRVKVVRLIASRPPMVFGNRARWRKAK